MLTPTVIQVLHQLALLLVLVLDLLMHEIVTDRSLMLTRLSLLLLRLALCRLMLLLLSCWLHHLILCELILNRLRRPPSPVQKLQHVVVSDRVARLSLVES